MNSNDPIPLKIMILKSTEPNDGDNPTMRETKDAARENQQNGYSDPELNDFLSNAQHLIQGSGLSLTWIVPTVRASTTTSPQRLCPV